MSKRLQCTIVILIACLIIAIILPGCQTADGMFADIQQGAASVRTVSKPMSDAAHDDTLKSQAKTLRYMDERQRKLYGE